MGCSTTGDPTAGGLVGWSRDKADQRANHLERTAYSATKDAEIEQQRSKRLANTLASETANLTHTKEVLNSLMIENRDLYNKLNTLKASNNKLNKEILMMEDERNELMLQLTNTTNSNSRIISEQINSLNERYKEAILILLQP